MKITENEKGYPYIGAPVVVEQKYSSTDGKLEFLLKKTVNQFDGQENIVSQTDLAPF